MRVIFSNLGKFKCVWQGDYAVLLLNLRIFFKMFCFVFFMVLMLKINFKIQKKYYFTTFYIHFTSDFT
jgi:hypothetical protein